MKKSDEEMYALLYNTPNRKCSVNGKILPYTECVRPGYDPVRSGLVFVGRGKIHSIDGGPSVDDKIWDFYDFPKA